MNLILLFKDDYISHQGDFSSGTVRLTGRRLSHINDVQQASVGHTLRVGLLNGLIGTGKVTAIASDELTMEVTLTTQPPSPLPLTLLLALPRPKMLKRTLQTCAAMGVKQLYLINSYRVDKSYWSSPVLTPESIRENLILGLEQCNDTIMPSVHLRKRFKPFVEDELPQIAENTRALVAHPYQASKCPPATESPTTLAVGPEGGFIPYEVEKLNNAGLESIHLGSRILRVETAVPVLLARLFPV